MTGIENMTQSELRAYAYQLEDENKKLTKERDELYDGLHGTALDLRQVESGLHGTALELERIRKFLANMTEDRNYFRQSNSGFETKLHNISAIISRWDHYKIGDVDALTAIQEICD